VHLLTYLLTQLAYIFVQLGVYACSRGSSVRHCCYLFNDVGHNGVTAVCLRFWLRFIIFNFSRPTTSTCQFRESTTANRLYIC